ncbi:hypothetical protein D8811_00770 [Streptococcus gordonii]|uniref:hypothetical protein n=1 Tax=Streptococcus gordonii TaxID=1302 RepID=UPI000F664C43|nr:hypothetical protein [Streptococcus gordonii]RSJ59130.1 hypothetical protein D8811_00770 [Streptococcus gordonii]RSK10064.1 hypothetical protein D8806_07225 [Streptococcus gordonii]
MDYKVQSRFFDPITNTTKVAIKQDFPYRVFEEILSNNRTEEDETTLVEAVLNIVRMELDPSGAIVALKKELDKSVDANKEAVRKIQELTQENEKKDVLIQNNKALADWSVLVAVTNEDNPLDPTLFKRALELVEVAQVGKTYKQHDIFTLIDPDHTEQYSEGKRVLVQVNYDFTYNGESVKDLKGPLLQNGKLAIYNWEVPKEDKKNKPSGDLETQPVAQPGS